MRDSLVGVDGNAYAIMGYTSRALKKSGHKDLVDEMFKKATSGDYSNLICVCQDYIDIANGEEDDYTWLMDEIDWDSDSIIDD